MKLPSITGYPCFIYKLSLNKFPTKYLYTYSVYRIFLSATAPRVMTMLLRPPMAAGGKSEEFEKSVLGCFINMKCPAARDTAGACNKNELF